MKKPHVLTKTIGNKRPQRIIFFDTETNQDEKTNGRTLHNLRVGVAKFCTLDGENTLRNVSSLSFNENSEFITWLDDICKKKSTTYLVAHNLVFDLSVCGVLKELAALGWKLTSWYQKGMTSIFRWKRGEARIIGLDNGNFFRGKLEYWGELFGYPKLDIDFYDCTDDELLTYCDRDVDIMIRSWSEWLRFLDDNECGSFKVTISSTAFNTYRKLFASDMIHIHDDKRTSQLEREAFKGGRTECFWVGERDDSTFYYLDVNQMYGYVMSNFDYPAGLYNRSKNIDLYTLAYKLQRFAVIARVTIDIDQPWFPMPIKQRSYYPVGSFTTTLTTPELKLCIDRGWLRSVHEAAWYRTAPIFQGYAEQFNDLRQKYDQEENAGFSKICKLMINGLYGKFGQLALHQKRIGDCDPTWMKREEVYDEVDDTYYDQVYMGGGIYREWKQGESYHSFPAITAHVTAFARLHLYTLAQEVPQGHVFYMDTDSLIVDQVGFEALRSQIGPGVLGKLKIERESPWLDIYAPKDYAMEGRIKRKGIRADAILQDDGRWKQTHWPKLAGLIREGINEGYMTKEVRKRQLRIIHSGQVLPSGWILPFQVSVDPLSDSAPLPLQVADLRSNA